MSQIEMVYLMKVSLHLDTMKDVIEFEKINKKCSTAIQSLKVNPWFNNGKDIEMFNEIFKPTTCNCNGFEINNSILLKAERIRNYRFCSKNYSGPIPSIFPTNPILPIPPQSKLPKRKYTPDSLKPIPFPLPKISNKLFIPRIESEEEMNKKFISIISKVESIKTCGKGSEKEFELLLENMKPNLKISCDESFFIAFESTFRKLNIDMNFYPKQIIINRIGDRHNEIFDYIQESNQRNIICCWNSYDFYGRPHEFETKLITSKFKNYVIRIDSELMLRNENVVLMVEYQENIYKKQEGRRSVVYVSMEDFADEEKSKKCIDLINKVCATKIIFDAEKGNSVFAKEKIKLPECVKEIVNKSSMFPVTARNNQDFKLPFSLEGIEVLNHCGIFEINERNDLKVLNLEGVDGISYYESEKGEKEKEKEWGNENTIDYFQKLTKLDMMKSRNIKILSKLQNLEYLKLFECQSCHINIDSMNLKEIYLNCNNSKIKLKMYRNDIKFIISNCSFVDIEIECEEGIKPNIEITSCKELKIKSNNEMGNILIENSNDISFNEGFKCELIQLYNSETTEGLIEAKVVRLLNIFEKCPINLNKANEIYIGYMNNFIFRNKFESCKKLIIDECNDCDFDFDLGNNQIEEMKVMICKSTNIEGTLPNIKSFVSIENNECKLPITNNIITTDEEIIELKENMKIVTDKKHLIIRNGKDVRCEIESLIKSDITFEKCQNINVKLKNKIIGILEFNNCSLTINTTSFFKYHNSIEFADPLIVSNSCNSHVKVKQIISMIKIKDSDLILKSDNQHILVNNIQIENSNFLTLKEFFINKCVIINSETELNKIINACQEELVLKKIEGGDFYINEQVKKITFEDCSKLQCRGDLKGKEVKLIRCSEIKLKDSSNSIQMESCQNIEVDTQIHPYLPIHQTIPINRIFPMQRNNNVRPVLPMILPPQ